VKILHITNYMHPHIGGIEQTTRDIIDSLKDDEHRIICFNHEKGNRRDQVDGVDVFRCAVALKVASQAVSFSFNRILKKELKSMNPDLVIFHYPNPFEAHYLLKYLKKNHKTKLMIWWHLDITRQKILGKLFEGQTERLLKRANKVIATSPNYLECSPFLSRYKAKCVVIPSCINEKRLKVSASIIKKSELIRSRNEGKVICFAIGRHVKYKGYEYLIKASSFLDDKFKIYLAGEGVLTSKLKRLAKNDTKVEFLGRLSDDEMKAYMMSCAVYCFPSITKNEAFGLALAEAMYFAKPSVTFTIKGSGVNYVSINGVTGIEVENGNSEKFAEAIQAFSHDPLKREQFGASARARVLDYFTLEKFEENLNILKRELV